MFKINSLNARYLQLWTGVLVYSIAYWLFNINGLLIDNDTIEYIGFAKKFENYVIPTSPYYQPGTGFFIWIIKNILNINYILAFKILNFISGLFLVMALIKLIPASSNHIFFTLAISISPAALYLSSLLYADIVFLAFTFWGLVFLRKHTETNADKILLISGLFLAISIFIKYNGIAIVAASSLYIMIVNFKLENNVVKNTLSKIIILTSPSIAYIVFWKIYNGKLGLVEFTDYMHKVDAECITFYLKHNTLSLYRLVMDRVTLGLTSFISHYYMWGVVVLFCLLLKKRLKYFSIKNNLEFYNTLLLLIIVVCIYAFAVTLMHSLNCYTEPEVRLYSVTFIGSGLIGMILLNNFIIESKISKYTYLFALLFLCFMILCNFRVLNESNKFRIQNIDTKYTKTVNFLNAYQNNKPLLGYATQFVNRQWFVGGHFMEALAVFPMQKHHFHGSDYIYTDTEYVQLINNTIKKLPTDQVLVVEFMTDFCKKQNPRLILQSPIFVASNIYVYRGMATNYVILHK